MGTVCHVSPHPTMVTSGAFCPAGGRSGAAKRGVSWYSRNVAQAPDASPPFVLEVRERRLICARVFRLSERESARAYARDLGAMCVRIAAHSPVLCADHRPVLVYAPEVADELVRLFTAMNSVLSRIAVLGAPTNATLIMQLGRIIREAGNPSRQLFTDAAKADEFLGAALDEPARAALSAFLAG